MPLAIPTILAAALVYGLTPEEATAWATALGVAATALVGVLENLIRKVGGAILDAVREWSTGVDASMVEVVERLAAVEARAADAATAIDGRFAAVESRAAADSAALEACRREVSDALARVARLEAVTPQVPSPGPQP